MRAEPALGENNVRRMNTRSLRNASPQPDTCASGSLNCLARCGRRKSYTLPHTHDVFRCPSCAHSSRGALGDPLRSPVLGQLGVPGRRILCRVHTPSLLPASRYSRTATEGTAGGSPANQGGLWRRHTETWLEPRGSTAPPTCRPPASLPTGSLRRALPYGRPARVPRTVTCSDPTPHLPPAHVTSSDPTPQAGPVDGTCSDPICASTTRERHAQRPHSECHTQRSNSAGATC